MKKIACATGNNQKFGLGKAILADFDIELIQKPIDIDEIQGEEPEKVLRDKVMKAYEILKEPVVVTDDWWDIPALGGFPGAYMKSINHWFEPQDFIHLMQDKRDRRIFLHAHLAYFDGSRLELFQNTLEGRVADAPRGEFGPPVMHVAEMDYDDGKTISEVYDQELQHLPKRLKNSGDAWPKLGEWLKENA